MKRKLFRLASLILIIPLVLGSFLGLITVYAKKNVDFEFDEELFSKAKIDSTIYYYAYNTEGKLEEVYKGTSGTRREWTDFSDIGIYLKQGFIAMEDREFYNHHGINYKRTALALLNHIFRFRDNFGASTITQQLIKNISGDNKVKISRKVNEILRALNLERNHSKDDIFELYLNVIPMSGNIYGVGAASEIYFGKEPYELSVEEAATLVGITNAPSRYNPYVYPDDCVEKRNKVIFAMYDCGFINDSEYEKAIKSPLTLNKERNLYGVSSWFVETANEDIYSDIYDLYGLSRGAARLLLNGSRVVLTMNPEIQKILEDYFYDTSNLSPKLQNGLKYSMVVSDPYSGNLLGIIGNGGKKSAERLFNYATAPITPGSVIKPLSLYAPLINDGIISWSSLFDDSPIEYKLHNGEYIPYPKNSPDIYEGNVDVNYALSKSKNTVAIRLFDFLGAERIFGHLSNDYGFTTLVREEKNESGGTVSDLSSSPLALGQLTRGVSLRELTESYNVFPNEGVLNSGKSYISVLDSEGKTILEKRSDSRRIYDIKSARIMNQLLSNVVSTGTARSIRLKELVDTAGKTGTSGGDLDRLFVGYTPYYSAGIWCGYDRSDSPIGVNSPSHLNIWDEIMRRIHEKLVFPVYDDNLTSFSTKELVLAPYCSKSGLIPSYECELDDECEIRYGYFTNNNAPSEVCNNH